MIALGIVEYGWAGAHEIDRLHREHYPESPVVAYRLEGAEDPILSVLGWMVPGHAGEGWRLYSVPSETLKAILPQLSGVRRMQIERALGENVDETWRGRVG